METNFCLLTSAPSAIAGLTSNLLRSLPSLPTRDLAADSLNRVRNARNSFCSSTPDDVGSEVAPPFSGGQCAGDIYRVFVTRNGGPETLFTMTNAGDLIQGPVGPIVETVDGAGLFDYSFSVGNGEVGVGSNFTMSQNFEISRVENVTDPSDSCGNPPNNIPDYDSNDFTTVINITFDDSDTGSPVTLSPELTFSPIFVDMDNNFRVPFNLNFSPDVNVSGTFNFSNGDVVFNNQNTVNVDIPEGPFTVPTTEDLSETTLVIVGARVQSSVDPLTYQGTEILQTSPSTSLFVPRLGTLTFIYALPTGEIVQGRDIDIKYVDEVVWSDAVAVGAYFSPQDGVSFSLELVVVAEDCDRCP